jgi:antitoxin component HigA of HigAB toxin-antitoxin module
MAAVSAERLGEIPEASGVAMVRHLMEENGLTQADLAPLFGSPSVVSEVLSGKRRLALSHVERLSEYFGLPDDIFIDRTGNIGRMRSSRRPDE